jgi:hypothetical protein
MHVALCVACRVHGFGSKRTCTDVVGRGVVVKNLNVLSEFNSHGVEIGERKAKDEGSGA